MATPTFDERRGRLEIYFDRTARDAWAQLTSDAPVSGIRATVRAGRDRMRDILLSWLPLDMAGRRLLDAGCGTGALSLAAARRGARVVAVDIADGLVGIARQRLPATIAGAVDFRCGDMLDPAIGPVDHAVAMDSLIHYETPDIVAALARLAPRVRHSIVFTVAPSTPALMLMHRLGRVFPRGNRAPAIVPVKVDGLAARVAAEPALAGWRLGRTERVTSGFYMSHALELVRA
ncbi:magnesium protoporphyrin IX methyltransferase [Zavarzinia sp. CC-PAN008]|uniref:magnesium protoporphyrin IX methyltransferase n=1 Tax=Zavarzinia sp. CC-PAN008 TaxID=3243332 RepID=UPI003F743108